MDDILPLCKMSLLIHICWIIINLNRSIREPISLRNEEKTIEKILEMLSDILRSKFSTTIKKDEEMLRTWKQETENYRMKSAIHYRLNRKYLLCKIKDLEIAKLKIVKVFNSSELSASESKVC